MNPAAPSRARVESPASGRLPLPAYGVLSHLVKDNLYLLGASGFVFTSAWVMTPEMAPQAAVILISVDGEPVEIESRGVTFRGAALAIAPRVRRRLRAPNVDLLIIHVSPTDPCFPAFACLPQPRVLRLDRARFSRFDVAISAAHQGKLVREQARCLFRACVDEAVSRFPFARLHDRRLDTLRALLRDKPDCSLPELAQALRLSYTGASRAFADAIGLPLRSYQLWLKRALATELLFQGASLTEVAHAAGFSDSSHFCRTWRASYGMPPSDARDPARVRIFA